MQKQNVISIDYLENPARFADLLNGYVYHGQEVVKAEDVRELNSSVARIAKKKKGTQINTQVVTADIVRGVAIGMKAVIVALENQTDIHYAMPWVKKEDLGKVNLVGDFHELLSVMLDKNLSEFQYVLENGDWKIVTK